MTKRSPPWPADGAPSTDAFRLALVADAVPSDAVVLAWHGREDISRPFRHEIHFLVKGEPLDGAAIVGRPATLLVTLGDSEPTRLHGLVASLGLVDEHLGAALHRLVLVPRVTALAHSHHSRVFVDETVPAIVQTVLHDAGFTPADYGFELVESYEPRDHVCQYQESSFDFVSRWMEREGMYYFFEHGEAQERMVIVDHRSLHAPLDDSPIRFVGAGGLSREGFHAFSCEQETLPGRFAVRGYDYLNPSLSIVGTSSIDEGVGEIHLHGDHGFRSVDGAKRFARLRAEERRARQIVYRATGFTDRVRAGTLFSLDEHGRAAFNARYLAISVEHRLLAPAVVGGGADVLVEHVRRRLSVGGELTSRTEVCAIRDDVQYRAPCLTPAPRIFGVESGVIDGELAGGPAQLDEHGRYRVRIRFDENDAGPGRASARVRMLQPHGGNPEGFHFPLRRGTEVLLVFLGGDPDRPIIAGVVPNAHTPSPVTIGNPTRNVVHTSGNNRIQIEDAEGLQHIHLRTPHKGTYLHLGAPFNPQNEVSLATTGNSMFNTGGNSGDTTGGDKVQLIAGSRLTAIGFWQMRGDAGLKTQWDGFVGTANSITFAGLTGATGATESSVQKLTGAPTTTGSDATTTVTFTPSGGSAEAGTLTTKASAVAAPTIITVTPPTGTPSGFTYAAFSDQTGGSPATPLNDGSDIKLVGGDNVTHVGRNNKGTVDGNQWSWVHGSQVSTVDQGVDSRVFCAEAAGRAYRNFTAMHGGSLPAEPKDLDLPSPEGPPSGYAVPIGMQAATASSAEIDSRTAQISTVYGDVFTWNAGDQTATVTGSRTTSVQGNVGTTVGGTQTTEVTGHVTSTLHGGQTSTISGGQTTSVDWTVKSAGATIDFVASKMSAVLAQASFVVANASCVLYGASYSVFSASKRIQALTSTDVKIDVTMTSIKAESINLQTGQIQFSTHQLTVHA